MPMLWMTVWIYGMNEVCAENVFGAWISSYAELTGLATKDVAPLYQVPERKLRNCPACFLGCR